MYPNFPLSLTDATENFKTHTNFNLLHLIEHNIFIKYQRKWTLQALVQYFYFYKLSKVKFYAYVRKSIRVSFISTAVF